MNKEEKLNFLITYLLKETKEYKNLKIPIDLEDKKTLFRSLVNIREAVDTDAEFLKIQDEFLQDELKEKGITYLEDLKEIEPNIYLWKGDISTLSCDAIVNAANNRMLGCFIPCHKCIDNAIHTYAGVELRYELDNIMKKQGHLEETGTAKITKAYNLPSKFIIHTVGPIIYNELSEKDCELLKSCYLSCLNLAVENKLKSIAFCSISTGEFRFPKKEAAKIAVSTVKEFLKNNSIKVIFDVFSEEDYEIYRRLLK